MQNSPLSLLIVEDQVAIAKNTADYFESKGFVIDFATNGRQGLDLALNNHYDVVILDVMMPIMDGHEVCKQLRLKSPRHIPIIMLTARDTVNDKLQGFESGADDYLTKPFAIEELEVRCLSLSRRHLLQTSYVLNIGPLSVDRKLQRVYREDNEIILSALGYKIILALAESYPQTLTRCELINKIWGDDPTDSDALRSHIYQLRNVIDKPFDFPMIKTIHGIGFSLQTMEENQHG
jgi:DNA-binding response OmpR family regulator